jgi:hypothetical protein
MASVQTTSVQHIMRGAIVNLSVDSSLQEFKDAPTPETFITRFLTGKQVTGGLITTWHNQMATRRPAPSLASCRPAPWPMDRGPWRPGGRRALAVFCSGRVSARV